MTNRTYATEFPDYAAADMPAIPQGFADNSWHNDACPCWLSGVLGLCIWTDYAKPDQREWPEISRYMVTVVDHDGCPTDDEPLLQTDDWSAVEALVATRWTERAHKLGDRFAAMIEEDFSAGQLATVRIRNVTYSANACATHDFCDANMVMAAAFEEVVGRAMVMDDSHPEQEAEHRMWGDAWGWAKSTHLTDANASPWTVGEQVEICSYRMGSTVVQAQGEYAILHGATGSYFLAAGDPDEFCFPAEGDHEECATLADAQAQLAAELATYAPEEDAALKAAWDAA